MVLDYLPNHDQVWDLCIVGAGTVGLGLAIQCERLGLDVLMLESGGSEVDPKPTSDSDAVVVNPLHHDPMGMTVRRALGGTSWLWPGRCVPFDTLDFVPRDFVPGSDWPIGYEDLEPWYKPACEYLQAGSTFQIPFKRELGHGLTTNSLEQWTKDPRMARVYRERLQKSERIKVSLRSTVIDLDLGEQGRSVEALVVATDNGNVRVKARRVVFATGGVEATRLLLTVQRRWPDHFGGTDGPLGRYYMGHMSGTVATLAFDNPASSDDYDFFRDATGSYCRRRFMLTWEAQQENKVLNTAFWLANPQFCDSKHGSGLLSALFLALVFPPIGQRLRSEATRTMELGQKPYRIGAHLFNVLRDAPRSVRDAYMVFYDRAFNKPKLPAYTFRNRGGRFKLRYHAEQVPDPNNRITLTDELDRYGLPRVSIDFRFTDQDIRSIVDSHYLLDTALQANGIGHLEYRFPSEQLYDGVMEQSIDGHHQVGTTRMGDDPRDSVVDPNLKVHGVDNLYVVSTSVYRTDGQANSTLPAVAFAMRLAHHIHCLADNPDYVTMSARA
jgi:choline dehydrogenase-like flavoprotein